MRILAHLIHLSLIIRLAQTLPFVVGVLTLTEGYLHLRQSALVDKEAEWDNRLAGVLCRLLQFAYLAALEQQLAVAFGFVVGVRTEPVFGDVHLFDVHLSVLYRTIRIHQRGFAFADGFDLRAEELNTRRVAVEDDVLKLRFLVQYLYVALFPHFGFVL